MTDLTQGESGENTREGKHVVQYIQNKNQTTNTCDKSSCLGHPNNAPTLLQLHTQFPNITALVRITEDQLCTYTLENMRSQLEQAD